MAVEYSRMHLLSASFFFVSRPLAVEECVNSSITMQKRALIIVGTLFRNTTVGEGQKLRQKL